MISSKNGPQKKTISLWLGIGEMAEQRQKAIRYDKILFEILVLSIQYKKYCSDINFKIIYLTITNVNGHNERLSIFDCFIE